MLGVYDGYLPLSHDELTSMTKAGGVPTIFHPSSTSSSSTAATDVITQRCCRTCGQKLYLLMQAFCPLPSVPNGDPHHRMMYVLCCNSAECASRPNESWAVYSYQVNADDVEAFDANDSEDEEPIPVEATPSQFLRAKNSFPPVAMDIIPEPKKEVVVPTDVEAEIIRHVEEKQRYGEEGAEEELENLEANLDLKAKSTDYFFDHFRRRLARCSSQILRYQYGGQPIFMNVENTKEVKVPPCGRCGGPRCMELQVMPTVLYYLQSRNYVPEGKKSGDDGVDFATATVYVCQKGCLGSVEGEVVQEEFLFVEPAPTMGEETGAEGAKPSLRQYFTAPQPPAAAPSGGEEDADEEAAEKKDSS